MKYLLKFTEKKINNMNILTAEKSKWNLDYS